MDVSIIIVNYNKFEYLSKCLQSVTQFTIGIEYEIILIDNNSIEGNISDVIKDYTQIRLIKNSENKGFAAANNQGLKIAKGKYCLLLNNDTELISNAIKEVFEFAESYSKDIVLGCQLLNSDGTKQESTSEFPSIKNIFTENFFLYKIFPKSKFFNKYYLNEIELFSPTRVDVVKGAFLFTKTKTLENAQGFDERFFFYSEETDLCYRLKKDFNCEIMMLPKVNIFHHNNLNKNLKPWFHFKNISIGKIQFYQKHFKGMKFFISYLLHFGGNALRVLMNLALGILKIDKQYIRKSKFFLKLFFVYPKNEF